MTHRVLTVAGLKGGTAKTSTATNLAAWWSAAGQRVLLINSDPNGSATKLHALGDGVLLASCWQRRRTDTASTYGNGKAVGSGGGRHRWRQSP